MISKIVTQTGNAQAGRFETRDDYSWITLTDRLVPQILIINSPYTLMLSLIGRQ